MLKISNNPVLKGGSGGVVITGSISDPAAELKWWLSSNPGIKYTKGFLKEGLSWSLDYAYASPSDQIHIKAYKGLEQSNELFFNLSTNSGEQEITYSWNEFDEMALEANLGRLPLESNENLRNRTLDVYGRPGNSTELGLINGIEREFGLPHMDSFFYIGLRFNPRTNKAYREGRVIFSKYYAAVQLDNFYKHKELVEVDQLRGTFTTQEIIGSENESLERVIRIFNGPLEIPRTAWKEIDDRKIYINPKFPGLDFTSPMYITYPYLKKIEYINPDKTVKSVLEIRTFVQNCDTVTDEDSVVVPTIVWNDGFFSETNDAPVTFDTRISLELANNKPPVHPVYYSEINGVMNEYIIPYKSKGFFDAFNIIPIEEVELSTDLLEIKGTWLRLEAMHSEEFIETLTVTEGDSKNDRNLILKARQLQEATRMGMGRTVVNRDVWGSDSPDIIGDYFIPSRFDGGLQKFTILTQGGSFEEISLNKRRYLAKVVEKLRP